MMMKIITGVQNDHRSRGGGRDDLWQGCRECKSQNVKVSPDDADDSADDCGDDEDVDYADNGDNCFDVKDCDD